MKLSKISEFGILFALIYLRIDRYFTVRKWLYLGKKVSVFLIKSWSVQK